MGTLEQELQKIHDAGLGVSITWLSDGGVDLRLIHNCGVVAVEGYVKEVAHVLTWLESAVRKHFPKANYEYAASPAAGDSGKFDRSGARDDWEASASGRITTRLMEVASRSAARNEP